MIRVDCAVIIVTYNSANYVTKLLDSIPAAADGLSVRVVVVDNDSTDETVQVVKLHEDVVCVEAGGNLGYAGGINVGRMHAGEYESLLILNPDLVLDPGSIREMWMGLDDPHVGIIVPALREDSGRLSPSLRRHPTLARTLGESLFGDHFGWRPEFLSEIVRRESDYTYRHPVDWATGAAMLISWNCDRAVGPWDEKFFLYSEEVDYAARARKAGFRVDFMPRATMRHRGGGSGQSDALTALMAVNRIRLFEKYRKRSWVYQSAVALHEFLRSYSPEHRVAFKTVIRRSSWVNLPRAS